jgi:hypothetical protein
MRMRARYAIGAALIGATTAFAAACNSDDDDAAASTALGKDCGTFQACGGDPIGTWSLEDLCYSEPLGQVAVDMFGPDCTDDAQSYAFHGSLVLTFNASSFHSESTAFLADESLHYTQKCLDAIAQSAGSGLSVTVAQFCPNIEANYQQIGVDATCRVAAGVCSCDLRIRTDSDSHSQGGSYSVMGDSLSFDGTTLLAGTDLAMGIVDLDAGAGPSLLPFCVQGDRLTFSVEIPGSPGITLAFGRK